MTRAAASIAQAIDILNRLSAEDFAEVMDGVDAARRSDVPTHRADLASRLIDAMDKRAAAALSDKIAATDGGKLLKEKIIADALANGDIVDPDDIDRLKAELSAVEAELSAVEAALDADSERLHRAIAEGRRDDAIDLLGAMTNSRFHSVREMRNLFPERIP